MTDDIVRAVGTAIAEKFCESIPVFTEAVEQELPLPCFFVLAEKDSLIAVRGGRYRKTVIIHVEYYPSESAKPRAECEEVSFGLFECLELLTLESGDVLRGTDRSAEYSDGMADFSVTYSFEIMHTNEPLEAMDGLNSEVNYGKKQER